MFLFYMDFSEEPIEKPVISPRKSVSSPISPEKTARLRDMLSKRKVTPVKSSAPGTVTCCSLSPKSAQ